LATEDVGLAKDSTPLKKSVIGNLQIDQILTTSHGGMNLCIVNPPRLSISAAPVPQDPSSSNEDQVPMPNSPTKRNASEDTPQQPPPRKRGRPPKIRRNDLVTTPKYVGPPRPRGRPKGTRRAASPGLERMVPDSVTSDQVSSLQDNSTVIVGNSTESGVSTRSRRSRATIAAAAASRGPSQNLGNPDGVMLPTNSSSVASEPTLDGTALASLLGQNDSILARLTEPTVSLPSPLPQSLHKSIFPPIIMTEEGTSSRHDLRTESSDPLANPPPERNDATQPNQVLAELSDAMQQSSQTQNVSKNLSNITQLLEVPAQADLGTLHTLSLSDVPVATVPSLKINETLEAGYDTVVDSNDIPEVAEQKRNSRRDPKLRQISDQNLAEDHPEAPPKVIFTPQDELDRADGIPRVYINLSGTERLDLIAEKSRGRRCKASTIIALFKSDKLKDANWLEARRGTWIEVSAERLAGRLIEVEDKAQLPYKRKRKRTDIVEGDTPKKGKKSETCLDQHLPRTSHDQDTTGPPAPSVEISAAAVIGEASPTQSQVSSPMQAWMSNVFEKRSRIYEEPPSSQGSPLAVASLHTTAGDNSSLNNAVKTTRNHVDKSTISPKAYDNSLVSPKQLADDDAPVSPSRSTYRQHLLSLHRSGTDEIPHNAISPNVPPQVTIPGLQNGTLTHTYPPHFASPRSYVSPFGPPSNYQSPYGKSTISSPHLQTAAQIPVLSASFSQESQRPGLTSSMPAINSPPIERKRRGKRHPKLSTVGSNAKLAESALQPTPNMHSGSMVDFHQRYSSSYAPRHQEQNHTLPQHLQPQDSVPSTGNSEKNPQHNRLQDPWMSMADSQLQVDDHDVQPSHVTIRHSDASSSPQPDLDRNQVPAAHAAKHLPIPTIQPDIDLILKVDADSATADALNDKSIQLTPTPTHAVSNPTGSAAIMDPSMLPASVLANTPISKRKYTRKQRVEDKISPLLLPAEAVHVPEGMARLVCIFQDVVGNLVISHDMLSLNFFDVKGDLLESPMFVIPIANIQQNPITSVPGSKSMELRVKAKDGHEPEITHSFTFAPSPSGTEAATVMRAKIVTAMIANRFRSGERYDRSIDVQIQLTKKYHCEKCDSRFKNINGLQYHQTKSNTTCNPNYVPPVINPKTPKRKLRKMKKAKRLSEEAETLDEDEETVIVSKKSASRMDSSKKTISKPPMARNSVSTLEKENQDYSDATDTSEDSILEWAKQNSTTGLEAVIKGAGGGSVLIKPRDTSRLYKALNRETEILRGIIKDITDESNDMIENVDPIDQSLPSPETGTSKIMDLPSPLSQIAEKLLSTHPAADMNDQLCEEILLALVRANDDIFPGERSLWFACTAVWLRMHPIPNSLPRSTLAAKAIDSLIYDHKVEKMTYTFHDKKKRHVTRSLIHLPGVDLKCSRVKALQSLVQESVPAFYVPPEFAPPMAVLETLQALASRAIAKQVRVQESDTESVEPESLNLNSSILAHKDTIDENEDGDEDDDDDDDDDDEFVDNGDPALGSGSENNGEMDEDISESDEDVAQSRPKHKAAQRRSRSAQHNAAIAAGVRRKWEQIRAGAENPFSKGYAADRSGPRKRRGDLSRLTHEQKNQRARAAELQQQFWDQAPAFMPNPETGAWDQAPSKKAKAKYTNRRLPEPVTYLQDLSGAWSVRPFGHGVNPIFARPARRAAGNPAFEKYMNKVQNGFRPVVYPKRNQKFLPETPSRTLMNAISKQGVDDISQTTKPKRVTRRVTASLQSIDFEDSEPEPGTRISRTTGKPVRVYRKKFHVDDSSTSEVDNDEESLNPFTSMNPFTSARSRAKKALFMTEVDVLNFFEPRKLGERTLLNPGLDTLPPSFGLDPSIYRDSGSGSLNYHQCPTSFRTPRSIDHILTDPSYGSWTMDHLETPNTANYNVRWDEQTNFNLETLPYSLLDDDGLVPIATEDAPSPKRRRISHRDKFRFSRLTTTHPSDFAGLFDDPYEAVTEFGVEMAGTVDHGRKRRQKPIGAVMPPLTEARFFVTVVVISTLTGGLENVVDWVLVQLVFPEMSASFMKKYWGSLHQRKKSAVERLTEDFQDSFIHAYGKGEVPPLDYDHLVNYDWPALIDWVTKNVDTQMGNKPVTIPETRKEFDDQYDYIELDRDESGWRESFYGPGAPVYRRIEASAAEPHSITLHGADSSALEQIDELAVAKSLIRAVALTPDRDYSSDVSDARIRGLGKRLFQKAFDILMAEKVIVHRNRKRATIGRAYEVSDNFSRPLNKHLKPVLFVEAAEYKRWLDGQFLNGVPFVRADYMANDGAIMCISSLQAHDRIRLVPVDVPMDKFGLTEGGYETRQIPREKLRFEMDIYPTHTYLYDTDNTMVNEMLNAPCPVGSEKGELPCWFGITDVFIADIWNKVVLSVGSILALRAGTNMAGLRRIFKSTLEEWECRLVLKWGEEQGYFKKIDEETEGWRVGEWWWLAVGRIFAAQQVENTEMDVDMDV
jgi:hypothetical protein